MTLLALLLGLLLERTATRLLDLREPRWFDGYLDWALTRFRDLHGGSAFLVTLLLVLLPVLPVALVAWAFREVPTGILFVCFGAFVLVFSLGPRDLKTEVDEYLQAIESGDRDAAARVAREITEHDAAQRMTDTSSTLEEAIFVQANNRVFGVLFWFMALGPAGAWLFRVSDLMRRRAVFEYRGRADDIERSTGVRGSTAGHSRHPGLGAGAAAGTGLCPRRRFRPCQGCMERSHAARGRAVLRRQR